MRAGPWPWRPAPPAPPGPRPGVTFPGHAGEDERKGDPELRRQCPVGGRAGPPPWPAAPPGTSAAMASAVGRWGLPATSGVASPRSPPRPGGRRRRAPAPRAWGTSGPRSCRRDGPLPRAGGRPVERVEGEVARPTHDHGVGRPVGHHGDAPVGQRLDDPVVAQHQRGGARAAGARRHVGRAQQVFVRWRRCRSGRAADAARPGRRRVVRGEDHANAGAAQASHRLVDAGDGAPAQPDHPIEVEDPRAPRGRWPHGRRG